MTDPSINGGSGDVDRVRALFEHFDANSDGHLSYAELRRLQLETSGDDLDGPTYCHLCESLKCNPKQGLTLEALRTTYDDDDADVDADYQTIFPKTTTVVDEVSGDDEFVSVFRELVGDERHNSNKDSSVAATSSVHAAVEGTAGINDKLSIESWQKPTEETSAAATSPGKIIWLTVEDHQQPSKSGETNIDNKESSSPKRRQGFAANSSDNKIDANAKIRALHRHFDVDRDKHLNYTELSALQLATSSEPLEGPEYCHLCREHNCDPRKGISLKALQKIYTENADTDLDGDYIKVFEDGDDKEEAANGTTEAPATTAVHKPYTFALPEVHVPSLALPELPSPSQISEVLFGTSGEIVPESAKVDQDGEDDVEVESEGDQLEGSGLIFTRNSPQSSNIIVDDRVRALHQFFDVDGDDRLDYCELRNLQLRTSGEDIDPDEYRSICLELDVDPREGLTIEALQQTYSSGDGNIQEDYRKVFPSDSVAAMFSSPRSRNTKEVNIRGDYPYLEAERLDKVSLLFDFFDADKNGLLCYSELRQLQLETSGEDMDGPQFMTVCQMYKCDPREGLKLENLREIYLSQGVESSLDADYRKVFRKHVWSAPPPRKEKKRESDKSNGAEDEDEGGKKISEDKDDPQEASAINGLPPNSDDGDII